MPTIEISEVTKKRLDSRFEKYKLETYDDVVGELLDIAYSEGL